MNYVIYKKKNINFRLIFGQFNLKFGIGMQYKYLKLPTFVFYLRNSNL